MKSTMTYAVALSTAIETVKDTMPEVAERLTALHETLAKRSQRSEDSKAKASAKRKEATAKARTALMEQVLPIVRGGVADGGTAKEIYERCADALPADFTAAKVQYILLHEMADEVNKVEQKGKPNVYTLR